MSHLGPRSQVHRTQETLRWLTAGRVVGIRLKWSEQLSAERRTVRRHASVVRHWFFSVRFSFLSSKPTQFSPTISIIRILSCDHYYQCDLLLDYHLGQINLLYFITTIIILDHRHRSLHHHHHHHPHRASLAVISQSCLVVRFLRYEIEKDCSDLVVIQCGIWTHLNASPSSQSPSQCISSRV